MANGGWSSEREAAVQAARAAGEILVERLGKAAVQMKGRNDPVSDADLAAQQRIERMIRSRFAEDSFVGEEGPRTSSRSSGRRWFVDPLDGTINYIHGFPFFAVSIGFEFAGQWQVGALFDPIHGEMFEAVRGHGATRNRSAIRVSSTASVGEAMVAVGLPSDIASRPETLPILERVSKACQSIRRLGSAALSLAYVAAGRLDAFYATQVQSWDVAAGVALVEEAGGVVTDLGGGPLSIEHCRELLASNGLIHSALLQAIREGRSTNRRGAP